MQTDPEMMVFTILALVFSIILHEVAHGYAANALGDPTAKLQGRLTLNPLPHIDPIGSVLLPGLLVLSNASILFGWAKPVPYNPHNLRNARWGEAIVSIAGVAVNIVLAVFFAFIGRFAIEAGMEEFATLSFTVAWVNLFLGLFNLIPFPPLDGFGVLRGLLPFQLSERLREVEYRMGGFTGLIIFLLVFSFFLADYFFMFVRSLFILLIGA